MTRKPTAARLPVKAALDPSRHAARRSRYPKAPGDASLSLRSHEGALPTSELSHRDVEIIANHEQKL